MTAYEACTTCYEYFLSFELVHEIHDKDYILIWFSVGYMSKMKAIKTFRDLLSFPTVIPLGNSGLLLLPGVLML